MPSGHAVAEQHQQQHKQNGHHDAQTAFKPRHHAFGDDESRQHHERGMPKRQAPRVSDDVTEVRPDLIGRRPLKVALAHIEDVIQRPTADHTVKR